MSRWQCRICNAIHDEIPMDIAYARPEHYFEIPQAERDQRAWFNDDRNADVCVIDQRVFLVRCVLPVPVEGGREFRHGVWVLVDESAYRKYATFEGDGSNEPAMHGHLSSEIPGYSSTFMLPVTIQLGPETQRPCVRLEPGAHQLTIDQKRGISMMRVHELVKEALPRLFN